VNTFTQTVSQDILNWVVAQTEYGRQPDDIMSSMIKSGWKEEVAFKATLKGMAGGLLADVATPPAMPEPKLVGTPTSVVVNGRRASVVLAMKNPRVVVFSGFLNDEECDALKAAALERLTRSLTVEDSTGASVVNEVRTSDGMFFKRAEFPVLEDIEKRISTLLQWPVERGEDMQVLRYRPGAEYRPHYDYFAANAPGAATVLKRGGQRVGTFLMYLNSPEGGGATIFPDIDLEIAPVKGNALFFAYERDDPSSRTLHGSAPVLVGEKWVATKWLRQGQFI
jgi:prolyl 4-hydroxylase